MLTKTTGILLRRKTMKKIIVPIIIVLSAAMLTACAADTLRVEAASNSASSDAAETSDESAQTNAPDSAQKADDTKTNTSLQTIYEHMTATELLPDMIPSDDSSYGFDSSDYAEAVFYKSSDEALPDEVVLVTANDEEAAEKIEEMLYTRLDTKAQEAQSHSPENYIIITSCVVERNGNNLALVVSADAEELTNIYLDNIN